MLKTVRLLFSKMGRAKYTSHLDINRMMTRAVRRAGIPLWYTEGFNRHPYLTFASPLSLGFESEGEIMEIRLVEDMPLEEVTARMNTALPEGFFVRETFEAVHKVRDLQWAGYRMELDVPTEITGSRTFVPVRFFAEALNMKVDWDSYTKTVIIND